jgi:hypothetical protein
MVDDFAVRKFVATPCTIATSANPPAGGSTSGGGTFPSGTSVTVTATPNAGYEFVNWTENGTAVSTAASHTFSATADCNLVANFVQTFAVATGSSPASGGSTTGSGTNHSGASVTVTATPNAGYASVNWTENGTQVSTTAEYTFNVSVDRLLVANFSQLSQTYTIAVSATPAGGGTASGGGSFADGASVTVHASANARFAFVNWTEGGTILSASADFTFTASADRVLAANFAPLSEITRSAAGEVVVSWPTAATGYLLFHNSSFDGANWVAATNAVDVVGERNQVRISQPESQRFFRLHHP